MIRVPSDSELEWRLLQQIGERLRERRRRLENYSKLLAESLKSAEGLSTTEKLKFKVLRRQFGGKTVPGLPAAVSAGRFLVQSFRKLRRS